MRPRTRTSAGQESRQRLGGAVSPPFLQRPGSISARGSSRSVVSRRGSQGGARPSLAERQITAHSSPRTDKNLSPSSCMQPAHYRPQQRSRKSPPTPRGIDLAPPRNSVLEPREERMVHDTSQITTLRRRTRPGQSMHANANGERPQGTRITEERGTSRAARPGRMPRGR